MYMLFHLSDYYWKFCTAEAGEGKINRRDLQKIAVAHDFMWSEKEIADMILHFDSDGDGKVVAN